jgi:hypothetical protein
MKAFFTSLSVALGACGSPGDNYLGDTVRGNASVIASSDVTSTRTIASSPTQRVFAVPLSCAADIGRVAAAKRVKICRSVSPATHPPCNVANSCAMIEDEIARSCASFDDNKTMSTKGCGPAPRSTEAAVEVVRRYYSAINARDL